MNKSKYNHLKSITHKLLEESISRRYNLHDPNFDQIDELRKRYIAISKKKCERYLVNCLLCLLATTNRVRYIRINTRLNLGYFSNISKNSRLSRFSQERYYFSLVFEMRFFSSSFRDMSYNFYLKQLPMFEVRLNQILSKTPRFIYRLFIFTTNSNFRK